MILTIREARLAAGLTHKEMSDLMEIPARTIGSWEDGSRKCPPYVERLVIRELERIAQENAKAEE